MQHRERQSFVNVMKLDLNIFSPRFRTTLSTNSAKPTVTFAVDSQLEQVEKEMIIQALSAGNNNCALSAELLGIRHRQFITILTSTLLNKCIFGTLHINFLPIMMIM